MRILLINPIIRISEAPAYFPLGLAYIAAVLEREGHEIEVLDINAYRYSPEEVEAKIRKAEYDCAGISSFITEYHQIKWLADKLKKYHLGKDVILGGGLASAAPEFILQNTKIDVAVVGEGEMTIKELLSSMSDRADITKVKGLIFKKGNKLVKTGHREYLFDLDSLPLPLYDKFPVEIYAKGEKGQYFYYPARTINIITSRGCPYRCVYCYHGISGYKWRKRSAASIVDEMVHLKQEYGLDGIVFSDDTFVLDRARVIELCAMIRKRKISLKWSCNGRVNLIDEDLLKEMKSAGCVCIGYGIESGSQKILDNMKKGFSVQEAERAVLMTKKAGIRAIAYFMIGMIGETQKTINETVRFCKRIVNQTGFSITTPFPGTELYDYALEKKMLPSFEIMLKKWSIWNSNILVNLSQLSDEKLLLAKDKAEKEINSVVINKKNEIFWFISEFGVILTLKRLLSFFLRKIYPEREALKKDQDFIKRQQSVWRNILSGESSEEHE